MYKSMSMFISYGNKVYIFLQILQNSWPQRFWTRGLDSERKTSRKHTLKNRMFIHIKGIRTKRESEKLLTARVREAERLRPREGRFSSVRMPHPIIQGTTQMPTLSKAFSDHLAQAHIHIYGIPPPLTGKLPVGRKPESPAPGTDGI